MTVVGFGDFSLKGSPVRRKTCGPLQDLRRHLRERDNVFFMDVDEHRTSVTCHDCHCTLVNMQALSARKKRTQPTGALHQQGWAAANYEVTTTRTKVHKVLHCCSNDKQGKSCCGTTWNRDVNASKNMLCLTLCMMQGQERPSAFCRQAKKVRKARRPTPLG